MAKSAAGSIIQRARLSKVPAAECESEGKDRWSPLHATQNQPSGFLKCCCLHMASEPSGEDGGEKEGGKAAETERGIPEAPPTPPAIFISLFIIFSFLYLFIRFFFPLVPGCDGRSSSVGVGSTRRSASQRSGPRSESATLDGVCLCPGDRSASARVWGTLSDDSECVIYELWKGCISSTRGRPHGKWRNSEFINIQ